MSVILTKGNPVSLAKASAGIHINLNWKSAADAPAPTAPQPRRGLFGRRREVVAPALPASADLDLGCMYIMKDGSKRVVQALGGNFGARDNAPYIILDGDDRTGNVADGENLHILRPDLVARVLVFAFIYKEATEASVDFASVNATVRLKTDSGDDLQINLDNPQHESFCAIAMIENVNGRIQVTKLNQYYNSHRDCDAAHKFGFNWKVGRK